MGFEIWGKWPCSYCFVGCCFKYVCNTARCIVVQFPSDFFSARFVRVHVVLPYSRIDATATWNKSRFISLDKSDFHMIDTLLIAAHAFTTSSLSVDETLLWRNLAVHALLIDVHAFTTSSLSVDETLLWRSIKLLKLLRWFNRLLESML